MGYVATALHWTCVALNLSAALSVRRDAEAEASALRRHVERTVQRAQ
jgi:hypothetical protein